jgi:hypothetical protein
MMNVKVGDEVRVFPRQLRDAKGDGTPGKVTRVGRTLFGVEVHMGGWSQTVTFRMENGTIHDRYGHMCALTPEEVARRHRHAAAAAVLQDRRVVLDSLRCRTLTVEQMEALAEVVATFQDED